jgi:hypothetical protein
LFIFYIFISYIFTIVTDNFVFSLLLVLCLFYMLLSSIIIPVTIKLWIDGKIRIGFIRYKELWYTTKSWREWHQKCKESDKQTIEVILNSI